MASKVKKKYTATTAPTGLTITRSGGSFTFTWKQGDSDYNAGQQFLYQVNNGPQAAVAIAQDATSVTLNLGAIAQCAFWVCGRKAAYTKSKVKYIPNWSDWVAVAWGATVPAAPTVNYSRVNANSGTFSWQTNTSDTETAVFTSVQYQTCLSRNTQNPPTTGWNNVAAGSASGSITVTESSSDTAAGSMIRWFRARSTGPAGNTGWVYTRHAYGTPRAASLATASATNNGTTSRITASWAISYDILKPVDTITVQYVIASPTNASLSAPASGWADAISVVPKGGSDKVVVNVDNAIDADECMWLRIKTSHDDLAAYSGAKLAQTGTLATPGINATPNATTGNVAITVTRNTSCSIAYTAIFYRSEKKPSYDQIVAILSPTQTSTTVHINEIASSHPSPVSTTCFGAYSFIGTYSGLSVSAKMKSGIATDTDLVARPPAWLSLSEGTHDNTVRIGWPWTWSAATDAELSWADHDDAWESTDEPETYIVEGTNVSSWIIAQLDVGKRWYFRARFLQRSDEDEVTGPWSNMYDYDLSSAPDKPVLMLSKSVVNVGGTVTASWGYASEDGTAQDYADICLATVNGSTVTYGSVIAHAEASTSVEIARDWQTGQTYYLCVRTTSTSGRQSAWSDPVAVYVADPVVMEITQTSLETVDDASVLTELPLTATVTGAGTGGTTILSIVRATDYHIYRPDEKDFDGYAGETIATYSQMGEGQITIALDDLIGSLDDGAQYKLIATVEDEYGQTASEEIVFTVDWTHKAGVPGAVVEVDPWQRIAVITPIAPDNYEEGDTCEIYRITADQPELIYKGAEFGTAYVDPYPAFGEFCGHRIVTRTANGDYTTDMGLGWFFADSDVGDVLNELAMIIDVDGDQIELPYNIELSNRWTKDFERTTYLGGSVQGDWNPAVTRDMSANTVIVRDEDIEAFLAMRDLAGYAGIAHIRTPDGSSLAANISVNETESYDDGKIAYALTINAIDPQGMDGVTLDEWNAAHPAEEGV